MGPRPVKAVPVQQLVGVGPLPAAVKLRLLIEVAATYVRVRLLVRRHPIAAVACALRPAVPGQPDELSALQVGRRLASPVRRALDPGPWDSRCLMQSLVLLGMLASRGIPSTLVIGVRPGETFEAHAWVECQGRPLLPSFGFEPLTII
jgi:hypothetical protein